MGRKQRNLLQYLTEKNESWGCEVVSNSPSGMRRQNTSECMEARVLRTAKWAGSKFGAESHSRKGKKTQAKIFTTGGL